MTFRAKRIGLYCSVAIAALVRATAALGQSVNFDVPSDAAVNSIPEFARQAGIQIVAPSDQLGGVRTHSVKGNKDLHAALEELLAGTSLEIASENGQTVMLRVRSKNAEAASNEEAANSPSMETVVVTGTNIRGGVTASPVQTYGRREIDQSGYTTTQQFLASLPQNWNGGASEAAALGGAGGNSAFANPGADSGVNLRGLGPQATLTLLNGQRLAPAGLGTFVDISMLPLSVIDHVDVVADGASAIYGSDAIGGVVNIVLRQHFDGAETTGLYGAVTEGGYAQTGISQTFGKDWGSGSALIAYDFLNQSALNSNSRDFTTPDYAGADLLPAVERQSVILNVQQNVAAGTDAHLNAFYSHKSNSASTIDLPGAVLRDSENEWAVSGGIIKSFGEDWTVDVEGSWSRNGLLSDLTVPSPFAEISTENVASSEWSINGTVNGVVFELPGGPVKIAIGGEYRNEDFKSLVTITSAGLIASRSVASAFGELQIPLVGPANSVPFIESLDVTVAGRYENYSDFGSTTNPKFGVRYKPADSVTVRGTIGSSFHAPSFINQPAASPTEAVFLNVPDPLALSGTTPSLVLFGTTPDLKPETAVSRTVGVDVAPQWVPNLTFSATYFDTSYKSRIQTPAPIFTVMLAQQSLYANFVQRGPTLAQVNETVAAAPIFINPFGIDPGSIAAILDNRLTNVAATDVRGLDFQAAYSRDVGYGTISTSLNFEYTSDFLQKLTPTSPQANVVNTLENPPQFRGRFDLAWSEDNVNISGALNYTNSYTNNATVPLTSVGAFTTVDLRGSYTLDSESGLLDGTEIAVSAINLFDRQPPGIAEEPAGYDATNASPMGRFISLELRRRW
jgi:outer membrane receptor protein involved in Fe transport